jgi:hypothetical protein
MHLFPVGYDDARHPQDSKNVQAAGGPVGGGHIVVADQQDDRHPFIGQALYATGKFSLKRGIWALIFVGISGKHAHIHLSLQGHVDGLAEAS